jgi:hypothetical protein
MNWEIDENFVHRSSSTSEVESELKQAVLAASEYAFELLHENIEDDSMFCLFDWNFGKQELTIMVTDPSKTKLAKHKVELVLTGYAAHIADAEEQHEQIRLWIHNYITTAATFLQYSLVAAITSNGEPSSSVLL